MTSLSIAIIGAGVAGMAAGAALRKAGLRVVLFDKGRAPGGRLATRRVAIADAGGVERPLLFDHGAQFARARDPDFRGWLEAQAEAGAAQLWGEDARYIGVPGMSALARALAQGLEIACGARVLGVSAGLSAGGGGWRLEVERAGARAEEGPFDAVVVAAPAPQAADLIGPVSQAARAVAESASMAPCWAGLFAAPRRALGGLVSGPVAEDPVIAWVARRDDRQGRGAALVGDHDCVVAHARADWSAAHLESDPADIAPALRARLSALAGGEITPVYERAHRWRYALVDRPAEGPCWWDQRSRLGLCGDWLVGPRVEAAWVSGRALARAVLAS